MTKIIIVWSLLIGVSITSYIRYAERRRQEDLKKECNSIGGLYIGAIEECYFRGSK